MNSPGYKVESLAIGNRLRGLLAEFGVVVAKGDLALRRDLADPNALSTLPDELQALLRDLSAHWVHVRTAIDACDARIDAHARQDERCVRLRAIIGIGPITADAAIATLGSAKDFATAGNWPHGWVWCRRNIPAAAIRGSGRSAVVVTPILRTLLIQGARSSLQRAQAVSVEKAMPEQIWIRQLACRLPFGKLLVAIANKHARQLWAMLAHEEAYDADAWLKHPKVQRPAGKQAASRTAMA